MLLFFAGTDLDLTNDAALIFNMDESGFPLDPKPLKGVLSVEKRTLAQCHLAIKLK